MKLQLLLLGAALSLGSPVGTEILNYTLWGNDTDGTVEFARFRTAVTPTVLPLNVGPGVPEAATWVMLVVGFGIVGAGLRRRRFGPRSAQCGGAVVAALLLTAAATPAAASSYIDSTSTFYTGNTGELVNAAAFDLKPLNYVRSVTAGGIGLRVGAKVTASVGAKFEVKGGVSFTNTIGQVDSGQVHIVAGNPFGPAGNTFILNNTYSNSSALTYVAQGNVDASLSATAFAGANIYGKACLGACISGTVAHLGIGDPAAYDILGYHSVTNSVNFLGQKYDNALPKDFSSDTLPITARLEAIDVSGKGTGKTTTLFGTDNCGGLCRCCQIHCRYVRFAG